MTKSAWWVPAIDYRISTGVIFFLILLLLTRGERRRPCFAPRCAFCFAALCGASFLMRYATDRLLDSPALNALGYSVLIAVMCAVFAACHALLSRAAAGERVYAMLVAVTVYRLAWNTLKALTAVQVLLRIDFPWAGDSPANALGSYCIYFSVILLCYLPYRQMDGGLARMPVAFAGGMAALLIFCHMLLEFLYRFFAENAAFSFQINFADNAALSLLFYFTSLLYCVMSYGLLMMRLHIGRLERDNADMQRFIRDKQEYYQISREGIASLQTKCHDLKHQIALIRSAEGKRQFDEYVRRLEDTIDEYNTVIETGNECVDVVLTEKNILCAGNAIRFSYMIDGALFSFLSEMEIYALFGNVLDNAIESALGVEKPRRFISLRAARRGGMAILQVENSYANALTYENDLPVTNKPEKHHHGYGLRSVRDIANRHGGHMSIRAENGVFVLTVTMAAEEEK